MNALEIFFIAIAFNCLMFFGLCIYLTFLNKKERKVKTTKFDHSYDALRWSVSQKKQIKEPLHYNCRSFNTTEPKPEGADYMKFTILDKTDRKCNSKDEV